MRICGIKLTHDGAIALVEDGRLVFCIEQEKRVTIRATCTLAIWMTLSSPWPRRVWVRRTSMSTSSTVGPVTHGRGSMSSAVTSLSLSRRRPILSRTPAVCWLGAKVRASCSVAKSCLTGATRM